MQARRRNRGFTFIELLLAISITSAILLFVFQSVRYSMNVLRRVNGDTNIEVIKIVNQMSQELRCAYSLSERRPQITFSGTPSSVRFVSVVPLNAIFEGDKEWDLKERRYFLKSEEKDGQVSLMYTAQDLVFEGPKQEASAGRRLSSNIKSLEFSYFDGIKWRPSWNSTVRLPEAVRISLELQGRGVSDSSDSFSTVVSIPGS